MFITSRAMMFMFQFALIVMEGNLMTHIIYEGSMTFSDSWENDISRRIDEDAQITCRFSFVTAGLTDPSSGVPPLHSWQKDMSENASRKHVLWTSYAHWETYNFSGGLLTVTQPISHPLVTQHLLIYLLVWD